MTTTQEQECAHAHFTWRACAPTNMCVARCRAQVGVHAHNSPLLCLSLPDETNRALIHKMEGKNALVCNHWLLHRLGGWIKGQGNIISWYRPRHHTNYSFKGKQDYLNLTVCRSIQLSLWWIITVIRIAQTSVSQGKKGTFTLNVRVPGVSHTSGDYIN